jgi:streptogramin lyase
VKRRDFLSIAAAAPAIGAAEPAAMNSIPTRRVGKVEIVFRSPCPHPNGLQAGPDGLWMIDQAEGSRAFLVSYKDGKVLRSFETETDKSSGITHENGTLWIGSTYSREIVHCDAKTGKTIKRYFTPGAGVIYRMVGDPPARSSPLARQQSATRAKKPAGGTVGGFQQGQVLGSRATGTGAHGQEWRDGKLWMAVPPARMIFRLDPENWIVEKRFETAGNRPHGIGWEGRYLWCTDSNLNAFFKHDPDNGQMLEKIQLADTDPLPHGMTIWQGMLWYCDDVGVICRLRM